MTESFREEESDEWVTEKEEKKRKSGIDQVEIDEQLVRQWIWLLCVEPSDNLCICVQFFIYTL